MTQGEIDQLVGEKRDQRPAVHANPLDSIEAPCTCLPEADRKRWGCMCGPQERVLRYVAEGRSVFNEEQRRWCLGEIRRFEGWDRHEEPDSDAQLAEDVLSAWTDYARSQGY